MAWDSANFKWYQCATWAEGTGHGGAIGATEITTNVDNNIFDDVSDSQRKQGGGYVDYRKIFLKNLNADTYPGVKLWIKTNTPGGDDISIHAGGSKSKQGSDEDLTGTCTFTNGNTAVTGSGTDFINELRPQEYIYLKADGNTYAVKIASIASATALTLASNYTGTGGSGTGTVRDAIVVPFYAPTGETHTDVLQLGDLAQNASRAVWIKRNVPQDTAAYYSDYFQFKMVNT